MVNTIMMYWGYISFVAMIIGFFVVLPMLTKRVDDTPYEEQQRYFEKKKREYETN